jgi:hypothetical protein
MVLVTGRRILGATEQEPSGAAPMSPWQAETDALNGGSERVSSPVAPRSRQGVQ